MTALLLALAAQALSPQVMAEESTPEGYPPKTGLVDVRRVGEDTIALHFRDGYVIHHKIGQKRSDEQVVLDRPLNTDLAVQPGQYSLTLKDGKTLTPVGVHRKSKGTDFAWFTDTWVNGHAVNNRPDYAAEHWIYLKFAQPLGTNLNANIKALNASAQVTDGLSDSVHVNLLGYRPDDPAKFGYLYAWEGDAGCLDVKPYLQKSFRVVNAETGATAYQGMVQWRKPKDNPETHNVTDTPNGNYIDSDVADCDFSALNKPGHYYLEISSVGRSRVFEIQKDIYRQAFKTVMKGILGNRSGIDLEPPCVPYSRPAPHNTALTPGFKGMLKYTTSRYLDRSDPDASPNDTPAVKAGILGDLDVAGWYQDAGDWDSYEAHIQVPENLMLAYQLAPRNYTSGDLNLPDKLGDLPDILKEARWLPAFCYRLRHELLTRKYGTGGIGLRICGDYFGGDTGPDDVGQASWQDVHRIWTASGEDPVSTFGYAAIAANFALCLKQLGRPDPEKVDWAKEAVEAFDWAENHTKPGDEKKDDFNEHRIYALSGLALLTGQPGYTAKLDQATSGWKPGTWLWWSAQDGPALYLLTNSSAKDPKIEARFQDAMRATADAEMDSASKRALRWGGDWWMPMLVGQQTTPWIAPLAIECVLTKSKDPARSKAYFGAICTTADYFLGTNPLNQTWVTGLGPNFPRDPFTMDGWYEKGVYPRPGIIPYGPWLKGKSQPFGPWEADWANKSAYPPIDQWPGAERWFNSRCCPYTGEFTIHQDMAPAALAYGFLCSPVQQVAGTG